MFPRLRRGLALLPAALRDRALVRRWLAGAHRSHIVLVLSGALTLFALPPFLGWALPRLYPPVRTEHRLLGIPAYSTSQPDPRVAARREQLMVVAWLLWLGTAAGMLIAELPRAMADREASGPGPEEVPAPDPGATVLERPRPGPAALRIPDGARDANAGRPATAQRYRITRELGRGGMGVVHLALDTVLQRDVALKELPHHLVTQADLVQRFRQEARVLARLGHPSIVQVHDLIEDDGRMWIALEYVGGGTLADAMGAAGGSLPWPEAAHIGRQVAEGLAFAHAQGVIHRDIKPVNVLLTGDDPPVAKLTDFGLARMAESGGHTQAGSLMGSTRYISPEQVAGRPVDVRSDLYSFGVTLYETLAGRAPFEGEVAALLAQHVSAEPPDLGVLVPAAPPALVALVTSMLAKDPDERPQAASAVAFELEQLSARAA